MANERGTLFLQSIQISGWKGGRQAARRAPAGAEFVEPDVVPDERVGADPDMFDADQLH